MSDTFIKWQPKPPSAAGIAAPPSSPRDRDEVFEALGLVRSLGQYCTPVVEEPVIPTEPPIVQELSRDRALEWRTDKLNRLSKDFPDCEGNLDLLLETVCLAERFDDAVFLLSNGAKFGAQGDSLLRLFACVLGYSELVNLLLSNGVKPSNDLFAHVCIKGDFPCAEVFLSHGANINITIDGHTLLGYMCLRGRENFVALLLDSGALVYQRSRGYTPLYLTAIANIELARKVAIIKLLHSRGANIESLNNHGGRFTSTALGAACLADDVELTRELLELGANPYGPDSGLFAEWPLNVCLVFPTSNAQARFTIFEMLIDRTDVSSPRATYLLWTACIFGLVQPALLLLDKGVNPNLIVNQARYSPLMAAAWRVAAPIAVFRALLESGADVTAKDTAGRTVMDYLVEMKTQDRQLFDEKMKLLYHYHTLIVTDRQTNSEKEI
jgi:ankyrin repeat protein